MFGFSFGELVVICLVALVAVGPQKLPGMLRTLGQWVRKLRHMTTEVRYQSGIDELLRSEGIPGGLNELRTLLRGQHAPLLPPLPAPTPAPAPVGVPDPYADFQVDPSREYPVEGADAYGALADDLLDDAAEPTVATATALPSSEPSA